MKKWFLFPVTLLTILAVSSCKKDKKASGNSVTNPVSESGTVKISFDHLWEGQTFIPEETITYINSTTEDTLNFTMFRYYITNVKLRKADGSFYVQPDSYHIVNAGTSAASTITLSNVPAGNYTDLYYTFGVDSTRNVSGAQTGALDPANGMFWTWNTGYIMLKAEGISPNSQYGNFAFHLGGFQGQNKVVIEKQLSLMNAGSLSLNASATKNIHLDVHVEKMWENSPSLSVVSDMQNPGSAAKTMAQSFLGGMLLNHID